MKCEICLENKRHNIPFVNKRDWEKDILELVQTDVCGSFSTEGFKGEKYSVSFIDDYSKIARVYTIKSKSEVFGYVKEYVNECDHITGKIIKYLKCDNGKDYLKRHIFKFARDKGIVINNCPPYVHDLNGTAERFSRTIMDMSAEANVENKFWTEIICAAAYLKNRTLVNTLEKKTQFEIFEKRPDVSNLKLYRSKVFIGKPEERRVSKWGKRQIWEF